MDVIFDIKSEKDWAASINEEIESQFPDYFSNRHSKPFKDE